MSALGQPLHAEIELHSATREQAEALKIRLASLETFRMANIEYNPVLSAVRFTVEERNGKPVIRVSSTRPINEPFVDLLLEVEGSSGRLVREYTFILDPADLPKPQPVQMAASERNGLAIPPDLTQLKRESQYSLPASPAPASSAPVPVAEFESSRPATATAQATPVQEGVPALQRAAPATRVTPQPVAETAESAKSHAVVHGDTLGKIAREVAPEGVSLDQMLVALHRANPQAFIDNNMNRLRSGRILTVPDAEAARAIPQVEARRVVIAQANDFNQYKERLASQVAASSPVVSEAERQSASGQITTRVEELRSPTAAAQDRLQLSKSGVAADSAPAGAIPAGAEERIAHEKALAEADARIAELESTLSAMQRLLQLQNQELADRQAQLQAAAGEQSSMPAVAPVVLSAAEREAAAVAEAPDGVSSDDKSAVAATGEADHAAAQPDAGQTSSEPVAPKPPPAVATPVITEQPSFLDHMLAHPMLLPLTGILGALGVLGAVVRRRRKQQDALARDSFVQGNSLFGSTGGQSVDTNNSVFNTNFSPSASQIDANEVDPIAEADVYIAYQKDDQAEEILKDALRMQPARHNVRLKLLELYKRHNNAVAYAACAHEMYALTRGRGDDWLQAALLGRELDPENPLYADVAHAVAAERDNPSTEELDLGALLNSTGMPSVGQEEGALSIQAGGMSYDARKQIAGGTQGSTVNEWDVERDIAQLKAEAEWESSPQSFVSADQAGNDGVDLIASESAIEDAPLEFDISDISLELNAKDDFGLDRPARDEDSMPADAVGKREQNLADPLAEQVPSLAMDDRIAKDKDESGANPFGISPQPKQALVSQALHEPSLDLDIPTLPKPGDSAEQDDLNFSLPAGSSSLGDDGQMWEESQDGMALAQATASVPVLGPISAEAELSTKLDLAVAYREIGDKEGARELLEEVVASGHLKYRSQAQELLKKLA